MTLSRLRVPVGYAAGLALLALARPYPLSLAVGATLAVLGEALRIWASGHIEKTQSLATGGPYALTRNPLYLGSLLVGLGVAVAAASPWAAVLAIAYFAAFYPAVMREEASFLREKFGAPYETWAASVPKFLPRLWPAGPRASRFEWGRVSRNREWRTALALPLVAIILYVRARWIAWP
jgi:protein-S-isoprenylcysteine O-methyltransferase Ste14